MAPAVLLDVDGTLVDSNYHHALAWYMAFREQGVIVAIWRLHRHVGMGGDQLVSAVAGEEMEAKHGDALRIGHDAFFSTSMHSVSAFEGAHELIANLKHSGHAVVLCSSAGSREIEHYLDLLDVRELVDGWTTASDVSQTKPEPDLVLAALEKIGGGDAVMIGDTPWDVETAKRAGVPTITVLSGGFAREELERAGAAAVVESVATLRDDLAQIDVLAG